MNIWEINYFITFSTSVLILFWLFDCAAINNILSFQSETINIIHFQTMWSNQLLILLESDTNMIQFYICVWMCANCPSLDLGHDMGNTKYVVYITRNDSNQGKSIYNIVFKVAWPHININWRLFKMAVSTISTELLNTEMFIP